VGTSRSCLGLGPDHNVSFTSLFSSEWVTVLLPTQQIIGHRREKYFQANSNTGTDNTKQTRGNTSKTPKNTRQTDTREEKCANYYTNTQNHHCIFVVWGLELGSRVHKFTSQWVGLGWVSYLVGWVGSGSMKWTHGQPCYSMSRPSAHAGSAAS